MPQFKGDPRNGHRYRVAIAQCLANSDTCHLCGHHGAQTADHVIPVKEWLRLYGSYEGVNDQANLRPAHGAKGRTVNACPICRKVCNQARGARPLTRTAQPRSRDW